MTKEWESRFVLVSIEFGWKSILGPLNWEVLTGGLSGGGGGIPGR